MHQSQSWSHVQGIYSVELFQQDDGTWIDGNDKPFPASCRYVLPMFVFSPFRTVAEKLRDGDELVIEFESSGYYQPASQYGGPDHLGWPAEGGDVRTIRSVYVVQRGKKIYFPKSAADLIAEHYIEEIRAVGLDFGLDEPDYD
jgi:hypothetical protein